MNDIPQIPLLIDGRLVPSKTKEWHDVINPSTQEIVARVPIATPEEVALAISTAKAAFASWRNAAQSTRVRVMFRLQQLVREHAAELAQLISREHGKTVPDAEGEVGRCQELIEHACAVNSIQLGEYAENASSGIDVYTVVQPLGVCAGITAFNFPIMLAANMFPTAIACGNSFVLKPSEQAPSAPLLLARLALEAGLPPGVLNVIFGTADAANTLCDHPDVKAISFIGSTRVGTLIYRRASEAGKRCQSMLGAKNHCVVMPDAQADQAIEHLLGASFGAAGQRCMATTVAVFVGEASKWLPDLVEGARKMKIGASDDRTAEVGPLNSKQALERVRGLIQSGVEEGAELLLDGRDVRVAAAPKGNFVGPTILTKVSDEMRVYREEVFGPVLCVMQADTLDDAIAIVNRNPNGNGVSIYTQDGGVARKFQNEIDVGQVGLNVPIPVPVSWFSFTGSRGSKLGDLGTAGKQGVQFWTQVKTLTARWRMASAAPAALHSSINLK
ncbi:CoA-acylating methylmalonate-semialdehyde dehydrogenase [Herbaspirillum chlorophenolicum]|uniref:CoA-acylating methylmalonate-semialdehyde dehydrogenase n=1 Tax=Herbaspirillum chlorophenolicum TaxID=211589 RepID=UPI00067B7E25|nr:CoA-acylating methylmalonate-semialdehyde dehydrogenase [Herbaspirillum chlorophenolicum]